MLVDCGWGAARRIRPAGLDPGTIDIAVFTHMHTDHMTDVPDFLFQRWTGGAATPLRVCGPEGTKEMIGGFLMAMRRDIGFRQAHHGEKLHPDGIRVEVTELPVAASPTRFLEVDGLRLEAFEVDHFPVVPAFGYRATYAGAAVVFSGDTAICDGLLKASRGAAMLVCEGLNAEMLQQLVDRLRARGQTRDAALLGDVPSYHISTIDVAKLAHEARVGQLVLSHIIPSIPNDDAREAAFIAGMSAHFAGPIRIARDGQRIPVRVPTT